MGWRQGGRNKIKKIRKNKVFLCFPYIFSRLVSSDRFFGHQVPKSNSSTPAKSMSKIDHVICYHVPRSQQGLVSSPTEFGFALDQIAGVMADRFCKLLSIVKITVAGLIDQLRYRWSLKTLSFAEIKVDLLPCLFGLCFLIVFD